jgi:hypothetical protein
MKWSLIFILSLFGFLMAIATVFLIPTSIEIYFWIPIFLVYAYIIARNAEGDYFLHGLFLGIANSLWISLIHALLFTKYIFNNGTVSETLAKLPKPGPPRLMLIIYGPIIGVIAGIILGLLCLGASKIVESEIS